MKKILFILLAAFIGLSAQAQNRKAKKAYESAEEYISKGEYDEALSMLNEALNLEPSYWDARLLRADLHHNRRRYPEAVKDYRKALDPSKELHKTILYKLGRTEYLIGEYEQAKLHFEEFLGYEDISPKAVSVSKSHLEDIAVALLLKDNPVDFDPVNLGPNINTDRYEYLPALSADGDQLIFTRRVFSNGIDHEDFYISVFDPDSGWTYAEPLPGEVNSPGNEGAQCITADGNAIFYTACNREKSYGSCDLYVSIKRKEGWSKPINLGGNVNSRNWDSQPSISADGKTIYFSSNRKGGHGGKDIWKSDYLGRGMWTDPINLGPSINTPKDEISPFIHWDDETFYFASNGHPGMGGLDIFKAVRLPDGSFGNVQNIGYPINHYGDQSSLLVGPDGKTAFFTSSQLDGYGKTDLYTFTLPESGFANEIAYMRGRILDANTKEGLNAKIQLVDLATGEVYRTIESGENGDYFVVLPSSKDFALQVNKEQYLFYSQNFSLKSGIEEDREFERDVLLQPFQVNAKLALNNVFFETNSFELLPSSFQELNMLVEILEKNQGLKIEIGGHTDDIGSEQSNRLLSEQRAKSVYNYLIEKGIAAARMQYKGYGESEPVASNDTEKGRAANRRTEVKIISVE